REPSGRLPAVPGQCGYAGSGPPGGHTVSGDIDDALKRAHAARERSRAAHEAAKNTHRRAADLHYRAAHFQEEHAAAERELGHAGKAEKMEAAARRARDRARAEHLRAELL